MKRTRAGAKARFASTTKLAMSSAVVHGLAAVQFDRAASSSSRIAWRRISLPARERHAGEPSAAFVSASASVLPPGASTAPQPAIATAARRTTAAIAGTRSWAVALTSGDFSQESGSNHLVPPGGRRRRRSRRIVRLPPTLLQEQSGDASGKSLRRDGAGRVAVSLPSAVELPSTDQSTASICSDCSTRLRGDRAAIRCRLGFRAASAIVARLDPATVGEREIQVRRSRAACSAARVPNSTPRPGPAATRQSVT